MLAALSDSGNCLLVVGLIRIAAFVRRPRPHKSNDTGCHRNDGDCPKDQDFAFACHKNVEIVLAINCAGQARSNTKLMTVYCAILDYD